MERHTRRPRLQQSTKKVREKCTKSRDGATRCAVKRGGAAERRSNVRENARKTGDGEYKSKTKFKVLLIFPNEKKVNEDTIIKTPMSSRQICTLTEKDTQQSRSTFSLLNCHGNRAFDWHFLRNSMKKEKRLSGAQVSKLKPVNFNYFYFTVQ